ncbi:Gfo/Idh/MocA family oxidoreductase [Kribbella antibiotica]|uniref:Gfo/Idh/MocA family oxidoreductase n=1 Tax=Kribbella antibiotica TaxID=190195 RepID=A0A4R4ZIU5_9ACTN|nr:Gfo/Idh/MocA family oxidoreductase [Kribbella antibiotica]TDD57976.1 Gfo/Idh/MocA family oxidoreductase [Kribbella antibiotica]
MLRIALVGTENSHAREIIQHLNTHPISDAARIVALVGTDDEHNQTLMTNGGITQLVPTSTELIGSVDALIVTNRDGALHREHAKPFLDAGIPVWVDKPLAASTADARAILEAAERTSTLVTSYSAVRWVADADTLAQSIESVGELQAVTVTGPADPDSEYSGIFFYGIHAADLAQRLAPGDPQNIQVEQTKATVIARYRSNDVLVTLQLVTPTDTGSVPFHAEIVGREGVVSQDIQLDADYVVPGLKVFLELLATGNAPLDAATMLAPITVLEQLR